VTRRTGTTRGTSDPYGLGPARGYIAPIVAVIALLVVAAMTFSLMNGQIPFSGRSTGNGTPQGPNRTPAPTNVVIVEPDVTFPGSIVYAKAGNIWIQTGKDVRQLTDAGLDSMPSFSPDGTWIYFIRQQIGKGLFPVSGRLNWYDLATPELVRVKADGSAKPEGIVNGRLKNGNTLWFFWMRQPVLSPDGHTVAVVSDGTDPLENDVVMQFYDTTTKKFTKLKLAETSGLGHQDPTWLRDGSYLLLVKNGRDGTRGAPQIIRYNPENQRSFTVTGPGYLAPSPSPDLRYIAATRTDSFGTDIVVLDAATGAELLRVTDDDSSFSPVWSPAGDAIAFLHLDGMIVDLEMATLEGPPGAWTVGERISLTEVSGLDAASRPGWFVPASELPKPSSSAVPSGAGAASSASPSAAP
jgi:dipeptidyl aminopeptidase/acylaminoacyl peptidase